MISKCYGMIELIQARPKSCRRGRKMALKKLPVGIEKFSEFFTEDFYYVDKTGFIIELLENWGKVNLFTRPRRFGKSLNMSMLQTFFEIGCKTELFDGLKVAQRSDLCEKYMGKYPVISISLKDVDGLTFTSAFEGMRTTIGNESSRFSFLEESEKLTEMQKNRYRALVRIGNDGCFAMSEDVVKSSLRTLCELLSLHYEHQVILLVDEYDVPLDKAFRGGYYDEMVSLISNLFSNVLKSNNSLHFAVLTGCLRVSKESIFTGLNNLKVHSITDSRYEEYFGFTDSEVKELLSYYNLSQKYDTVKAWYDGYHFGNASVYCPWDVINYCDEARANPQVYPQNYWANTSGNALVRRFIDKATAQTKNEIESLVAGEQIEKEVNMGLTYSELEESIDNLWSVLLATGYLTCAEHVSGDSYKLTIPNQEIRNLFVKQIQKWFSDAVRKDTPKLDTFCEAFPTGDYETIESLFNDYLWNTISVRDTAVKKERKENFYHGILLGLLGHKENWLVTSNAESGEGYSDILIEVPESRTGVVIELKYAENGKLETGCTEALDQIDEKQYDSELLSDGMQTIVKYGIACFRKHCKVSKR
jgi:hypothetical protein